MKMNRTLFATLALLSVLFNNTIVVATPQNSSATTSKLASEQKMVDKKLPMININTADIEMLQEIKGVGQKKAEAIIEYRKQHGDFKTIEDLKDVNGIGDAFLNKIRAQITVTK